MAELSTPDVSAASSPAIDLGSLSASDLSKWRETGEITASDASAASSPAVEAEPPPSTEGSVAASEPAPPAKKGAEARKAELAAEIQSLLQQRADLKRELSTPAPTPDAKPAASSPAPVSADKPTWKTFEDQIGTTFSSWADAQEAWADARDAWKDAQIAKQRATEQARSQVETVFRTGQERITAYVKDVDPKFWAKVSPELLDLEPVSAAVAKNPNGPRTPKHDLAEVVLTSEFTPQWMLHLSQHPDVFQTLLQSPNPNALYRAMGRIEATFSSPQASTPASPVVQTPVSSAPPPPPTLGSKPSGVMDEESAALAAGDFTRYRAAVNAREMAARK